jgi:hypothetical protein
MERALETEAVTKIEPEALVRIGPKAALGADSEQWMLYKLKRDAFPLDAPVQPKKLTPVAYCRTRAGLEWTISEGRFILTAQGRRKGRCGATCGSVVRARSRHARQRVEFAEAQSRPSSSAPRNRRRPGNRSCACSKSRRPMAAKSGRRRATARSCPLAASNSSQSFELATVMYFAMRAAALALALAASASVLPPSAKANSFVTTSSNFLRSLSCSARCR